MKAFHGDPQLKEKYLQRVRGADQIAAVLRGDKVCWDGSSVRENLNKQVLEEYPAELGIPYWLARSEQLLFVCLGTEKCTGWPIRFLEAITPGDELERLKRPFGCLLLDKAVNNLDCNRYPEVRNILEETKVADWPTVIYTTPRRQADYAFSQLSMMARWTGNQKDHSAAWAATTAHRLLRDKIGAAVWAAGRTYDERSNHGYIEIADGLIELLGS